MTSCVIAGVGGQGTVLLSRLIGAAALAQGLNVRGSETIGMAQRGGSVVSHVRMSVEIHSPLCPPRGADLIIAFEPGEAVRALPFLGEDGAMIVCDRAVKPVSASLGAGGYRAEDMIRYLRENVKNLTVVDGEVLIRRCGNARVVNVALFGVAAAGGALPFGLDDARAAVEARVPARFLELNQKALEIGAALAAEREGL